MVLESFDKLLLRESCCSIELSQLSLLMLVYPPAFPLTTSEGPLL